MNKVLIGFIVLLVVFSSGAVYWIVTDLDVPFIGEDQGTGDSAEFGETTIELRDLRTYRDLSGILEYADTVNVTSSVDGILTYIATEGSRLNRGSLIYKIYRSPSDSNLLSSEQQLYASDASVAQAELALENLKKGATASQIASADAAVAQAELGLENLKKGATASQIASADASVAQTNTNLVTAMGNVDKTSASFLIAQDSFCDHNNSLASWDSICSDKVTKLDESATNILIDMIGNNSVVTKSNNLLIADKNYKSALEGLKSSELSFDSSKHNRAALDEGPTDKELIQATKALESAMESRAALDEGPTDKELTQATKALESAMESRAALDEGPTDKELIQAQYSLRSAKMSKTLAATNFDELETGYFGAVLMFGKIPAWRKFIYGMTPGQDVQQLRENIIALGYASPGMEMESERFDKDMEESVKRMQTDLGLIVTGILDIGDVVFLSGTTLVESSVNFPVIGSEILGNNNLLSLTPLEVIDTKMVTNEKVTTTSRSSQVIETSIEVSDQDLIWIGAEVRIELPDEDIVLGKVQNIGSVAIIPQSNQTGDPYFEVTIISQTDKDLHQWTGAPVTVSVTKEIAKNVLSVPVSALLALLGGGYGLEVIADGTTRLIPVGVGIYADGWVEVNGDEVREGTRIVLPK